MKDVEEEHQQLKQQLEQFKKLYQHQNRELEINRNIIKQQDQQKQLLIEEMNKLQIESKSSDFEKKLKNIIEGLPCLIEKKSLIQISNSTITNAKAAIKSLVCEYKNAYKSDNEKPSNGKYQELFESFYIVGVKHKQLEETQPNDLKKPKFLFKQYKNNITTEEKINLRPKESEIKLIFEQNLLQVEMMDYKNVQEKILELDGKNERNLLENFFFINLNGVDQMFDNLIPNNMQLLTQINIQKQLFLFVLGLDDYMTNSKEYPSKFWKIKKFYCFLTYFPIFEIFEQALLFINAISQNQRKPFYEKLKEKQIEQKQAQFYQQLYSNNDALKNLQQIKDDISNYICELSKQELRQDQPIVYFQFLSKQMINAPQKLQQYIVYKISDDLRVQNMLKPTQVVMQIFCNQLIDFLNILTEVLKEGQIVICCENINILVYVCYFFHQIIYPYIYCSPALYNSSIDTIHYILIQELKLPFIAGIKCSFNQLITSLKKNNSESLQSRSLTIIELCNNTKVKIHQFESRDQNKILQLFEGSKLQEIFFNYESSSNLSQTDKCRSLLTKIKNKIENEFMFNNIPPQDQNFVQNRRLNKILIKNYMSNMLKNHINKSFIMDHIFYTVYFETYLKHKYNCSFFEQ